MEPPHGRHAGGAHSSLQHNGGPPPYGSTFRPEPPPAKQPTNTPLATPTPPQPVRGGVQVLPPLIPPRGPTKTKPKPPVPPKRDQLTRLTTVKKEPIPIHRDDKDEAKPLEALERKINETTEPQERTFSETIEHFERQGSFAQKKKVANYENTSELDQPVYATINPDTKKVHNSESKTSLKSDCEPKESSSEEEGGATADIWVRAIDSPVKKPDKAFRSYSNAEEVTEKPPAAHRASIDNSQLKIPPKLDKPEIIVEKDGEEDRKCKLGTESLPCSRPGSRATSRSSSPANFGDKDKKKISAAEALGVVAKPCPRPPPGKRIKNQLEFRRQSLGNLSDSKLSMGCSTSCPSHQLWSSFGECQETDYKRHERSRGQSADSRTLQRLKTDNWETQSYSSTLSRIGKYSTTKYFTKTSTCPATTSATCPPTTCQDRPKSTCNCGRHSAASSNGAAGAVAPKDVGKRTFSVEELRSGGFVRGSNSTGSARSSFGKSPRVTFALSEDEMGATGTTPPSKYEHGGDSRKATGRARSYDADDRPQVNPRILLFILFINIT